MTTKEIRERIAESELPDWFNSAKANINYPHINFSIELEGFSSIHKWLSQQIKGWEEMGSIPNELEQSKNHFVNLRKRLENFIINYQKETNRASLDRSWGQEANQYSTNSNFFTYNAPQTNFLIDVYSKHQAAFQGAFLYIIKSYRSNNRDDFIGSLLAYEFESKDYSEILNRRSKEKSSLSRLRNKFEEQLNESETTLTEYLTKTVKSFEEYIQIMDSLKEAKESLFNTWFDGSEGEDGIKKQLTSFFDESKGRRENLELAYDKKLELSKPARYWQRKSINYFNNYKTARNILLILIGICALVLGVLLIVAPDYIFQQVFMGNEVTIVRWSLVFIAFLAVMAFAIRAVNKIMFSSLHLSRDAEERHALMFVYLSLLNEHGTAMDSEDRKLILQSLFSRSDTGLLKEDSGPTMPNDFLSKILNK